MMKKENLIWILFLLIWGYWRFLMKGMIGYWGETSFFQCSGFYWGNFAVKPGGWSEYIGNFLLQFYQWTGVGALIQTLVMAGIFIWSRGICKRLVSLRQGLWISCLPFVLVFLLQVGQQMALGDSLKILFLFLASWGYLQVTSVKWRYWCFTILYPVFFLILGTEVSIVLYLNFALYEFWKKRSKGRWGMIGGWLVLSLIIPLIWRRWIYVMPVEKLFVVTVACGYWLWVVYGYFICLWGMEKIKLPMSWKRNWFEVEFVFVLLISGVGVYSFYDCSDEYYFRLEQAAEVGEWDEVLQIAKQIDDPSREELFLINLALANRGELGEHLFEYPVWGIGCLYLPRELNYRTSVLGGELYYRLEIPNEALHWTFQASVAAPQGMDFRTLKRLIELNVMKGDTILADKYLVVLENTLGYGVWCKQKRAEFVHSVTQVVLPDEVQDFFIGGRPFLSDMVRVMDAGRSKDIVLDYILCGLLLNKDIGKFCQVITMFYEAARKQIPKHYQEALLVAMTIDSQAVIQKDYFIDPEINKRFLDYNALYHAYSRNKQQAQYMLKDFKNTWWYYFHFNELRAMDLKGYMLDGGQVYSL